MKYIAMLILGIIIILLISPILLIKWDNKGLDDMIEGLKDVCGID